MLGSILTPPQMVSLYGQVDNKSAYAFSLKGRRITFTSTSVLNDVVEFTTGTAVIPVLAGEALEIVSSSASDAAAGTGVRTVVVTYIDHTTKLITQSTLTLNGTTPVAVAWAADQVLWMEAATYGSGATAAGTINLRVVVGPVVVETILAANLRSYSARLMVPLGYTAYVHGISVTALTATQECRLLGQCDVLNRAIASGYREFGPVVTALVGVSVYQPLPYLKFPALSNIKVAALSGNTTARCDVTLDVLLIGPAGA